MKTCDCYISLNPTGPTAAVSIDESVCLCCNACANICRMQTILPNPEPGKAPILAYPDECWYCGCCVEVCRSGALSMNLPINQRVFFKRKTTGEIFRIGQLHGPEKSYFVPPYGYRQRNGG